MVEYPSYLFSAVGVERVFHAPNRLQAVYMAAAIADELSLDCWVLYRYPFRFKVFEMLPDEY